MSNLRIVISKENFVMKIFLLLFLVLLSFNSYSLPYRIEKDDFVIIAADGSLVPILKTYDQKIDYSRVYAYKDFYIELTFKNLKSLSYPTSGAFKLTQTSIDDLEYIKDKIRLGDALNLVVGLQAFAPLLGA